MNLSEKLLLSLGSPPYDQLQPLLWASLGALVCFVVMAWIGGRRKKRYQNLLIRYTALQEKGVQ